MARLGPIVSASVIAALAVGAAAAGEVSGGGGSLPAGERVLREEPESVVRKLLDAKSLVLDPEGKTVRAYVLFDRPPDRVYALLSQTSRQREYRSDVEELATVAQLPDGHVDEQQIRILLVEIDYRLRYRLDPERRRIAWQLDPSLESPMRRVEGSWELYPMDAGQTLGRLSSSVDMSDEVPAILEETVTRTTLPRTLERLRLWVNACGGGPCEEGR